MHWFDFYRVSVFARAEINMIMGLTRYWVFLVLAFLLGLAGYAYHTMLHAMFAPWSSTMGLLGPRFIVSSIGLYYLVVFLFGVVFLAFDLRFRDERANITEILDARAYGNMELVFGRFLAMLLMSWLPVLLFALLLQLAGWGLSQAGFPVGGTVEPVSLFSFPFFLALPAMMLAVALIYCISVLVRQQTIALVVSLVCLCGLGYLALGAEKLLASVVDLFGFHHFRQPSDLNPGIAENASGWLQRMSLCCYGLGLLFLTAYMHPRLDAAKGRHNLVGLSLFLVLGAGLSAQVFWTQQQFTSQTQTWLTQHQSAGKSSAIATDITAMQVDAQITPGDKLTVEATLVIDAQSVNHQEEMLFTLNPGMTIRSVQIKSGSTHQETKAKFSFAHGLLRIQTPAIEPTLAPISIHLVYDGLPNVAFAYLDSPIDAANLAFDEAQAELLGVENAVFSEQFVALMPGIHWLPESGAAFTAKANSHRDFFKLDLTLGVPSEWTPAGPGLRTPVSNEQGVARFRFAPQSAIPEVAVVAAPFEAMSVVVNDIQFELLMHPAHVSALNALRPLQGNMAKWLKEQLSLLADGDLHYPFKALTLVEVPNNLRSFAGGWQMPSTLAPPGLLLLKETGLPTTQFTFNQPSAQNVLSHLNRYFKNDVVGGNLFGGVAASIYAHQTSAVGSDGHILNYTLHQLTTLVLSGEKNYFSVPRIADFSRTLQSVVKTDGLADDTYTRTLFKVVQEDSRVWDAALSIPLTQLQENLSSDSSALTPGVALDLMALKGGGLAQLLYEILGPKGSATLIAQLLERYSGSHFTRAEFIQAVQAQQGHALSAAMLEDWFSRTHMAGYQVASAEQVYYDDPNGRGGQYQVKLSIRNDEPVQGFVKLSWQLNDTQYSNDPVAIEAKSLTELRLVLTEPIESITLQPYLSLNRNDFVASEFDLNNIPRIRQAAPAAGVTLLTWQPKDSARIVVDDLDPGFRIVREQSTQDAFKGETQHILDQGLPKVARDEGFPDKWGRVSVAKAWGQYRHTAALTHGGNGNSKAGFSADIPKQGRWKLALHVPALWQLAEKNMGNWELEVVTPKERITVNYNTGTGEFGWNDIAEYDLGSGEVEVFLSNKTERLGVIADAISWTLVR